MILTAVLLITAIVAMRKLKKLAGRTSVQYRNLSDQLAI